MGMTFSTIQIKNDQPTEPEQFLKLFCQYMVGKGLTPAIKEEAQFSCFLAFSDDGSWITLSSPEYDIGADSVKSDAKGLAKAMKTCCIETTVFDSDLLSLDLFGLTVKQRDTVLIGHPDVIGELFEGGRTAGKGKPECWIPLLAKNKTWEQLTEIWSGSYVFAEEALTLMAPFLGMDSKNISTDYRYWEEAESDNSYVHALYFKTELPIFIKEGATKLAFGIRGIFVSEIENYIAFKNIGGISKGLSIIILGECFKNHEVEISKMRIQRNKNPQANSSELRDIEIFSAEPKEFDSSDGRSGFRIDLDDYVFYEGVNMEHPSMKGSKGQDIAWMYESGIWLTATIITGNKHEFDLFVIPQNNWAEGQIGCHVELYKTKEQQQLSIEQEKRER